MIEGRSFEALEWLLERLPEAYPMRLESMELRLVEQRLADYQAELEGVETHPLSFS